MNMLTTIHICPICLGTLSEYARASGPDDFDPILYCETCHQEYDLDQVTYD